MSSDLFVLDNTFYLHSSPEMVSSNCDLFFPDPFSPFFDSPADILQEIPNNQNNQNPVQSSNSLDNYNPNFLSSSPPSHQLENLTLYQAAHLQTMANGLILSNYSSLANGFGNFSGLNALEVKTEECQVAFDSFLPHSYSGVENVAKMMQRSYSSNSFEGKPKLSFQPRFDSLLESPNYQSHPESTFQMRRVCSTGDLHNIRTANTTQRSFSSPLATESSFMEDAANFKVGKYSAEERKERISKYRAKRNQRNFTKTIKYACRKTLADNRPRIRGRFARNDESGEIPKATYSARDEDENELWFDGLHEEEDDQGSMRGSNGGGGVGGAAAFVNSFGQAQFQYYGY